VSWRGDCLLDDPQHGAATSALGESRNRGSQSAANCESGLIILAPGPLPRRFSPYPIYGRLWPLATQVARELCEDPRPIALAGSFAGKRSVEHLLRADPKNDAYDLHLQREPQRV
jgi:hypothetical protein